ncbi:MAG: sigma-70 family RNA polymerase sigma factor [Chloroflexota bacterium]
MVDQVDNIPLSQAVQGDKKAFGLLYERYVERIYNYIYYRTGNQFDAEDLTARVFFRALRHIENYEDRGVPFSAWLYCIAHNLVANWHRDNNRWQMIPLEEIISTQWHSEHPELEVMEIEEQEKLLRAVQRLSEDRQQLLILKFTAYLTNAEIGYVMGRTEGAIKSLYHRTLIALREDLKKESRKEKKKHHR